MNNKRLIAVVIGVIVVAAGLIALDRWMFVDFVHQHFGYGDEGGLVLAAFAGDEKGVEKYLAKGVPIDFYDKQKRFTPLSMAIYETKKKRC